MIDLDAWKPLLEVAPLPAMLLAGQEGVWSVVASNQAAIALFPSVEQASHRPLGSMMGDEEVATLSNRLNDPRESFLLNLTLRSSGRSLAGRLWLRRLPDQPCWLALVEDVSAERGAMEALRENERSYRRIVELSPDAIVVLGEGLVVFANQSCERLLGLDSPDEIWGTEFLGFIHPDDKELWERREALLEENDEGLPPVEMRLLRRDGAVLEVEVTQYRAFGGGRGGMQVIVRDIGPRKRMERELKESEERYKGLADAAFDGVAVHVDGKLKEVNRAFAAIFGRSPDSLLGVFIESIFNGDFRGYFQRERSTGKVVELEAPGPEGKTLTLEASTRACSYGGQDAFVTALRDISERKRTEELVRQQAYYDGLTGLPNRILFNEMLRKRLDGPQASRPGALFFLDLDRFKRVNDTLGHDAGDRLLQQAASRLSALMRRGDTVCRLGGDEFTVLLDSVESKSEAALLADRIIDQLGRPFDLGVETVTVGSSVGIAMIPTDGRDPETIVKHADEAMYAVKAAGRNAYRFWEDGASKGHRDHPDLEADLRSAIIKQEFRLHYLPKVDLSNGRIVGAEALIRWKRGDQLVHAAEFVPFAEEVGLTLPMGEWVLDAACRQARHWDDLGLKNLTISVNLSAWQLRHQALLDLVDAAIELYQVSPELLEFEVTESAAMKNPGFTSSILKELLKRGVAASLDDFGTGFSSLEHLKIFPIRTLKIDHSFVRGCATGSKDAAIVRAIIHLAHNLGLTVLAEGVETPEQARFLRSEGCDLAQGYLFSKAVPPELIPGMIGVPFLFD